MTSLSFIPINDLHNEFIAPWLDLYETAFPPEERLLVSALWKLLMAKEQGKATHTEMLAAIDTVHSLAGMALYEVQTEVHVATLWYMAIDPNQRSQGLGSQVYQEIVRKIQAAGCQVMIFEVEIPENAHTPEGKNLAERRIQFYRRNGAKLLTGIHYLQSVGLHQPLTPMHLMIHSLDECDPQIAYAVAEKLFGETLTQTGTLELK